MQSLIPFGSAIEFRTAETAGRDKLEQRIIDGILLGYREHDGAKWNGEYICMSLKDIAECPLHREASASEYHQCRIHVTRRAVQSDPPVFPLLNPVSRLCLCRRHAQNEHMPSINGAEPTSSPFRK